MTLVLALLATSLPLSIPVLVLDSEADLTQELLVRWSAILSLLWKRHIDTCSQRGPAADNRDKVHRL